MVSPQEILEDCAETHESKNADYGSSWKAIGEILFNLTNGEEVVLNSPEDFVSIGLFTRRMDKLARAFHGEFVADEMAHESLFDSHADESTYAAMHASTFHDGKEEPEPEQPVLGLEGYDVVGVSNEKLEEIEMVVTGQSEPIETSIGFTAESVTDEEGDEGDDDGELPIDPRYEAKYQELTS